MASTSMSRRAPGPPGHGPRRGPWPTSFRQGPPGHGPQMCRLLGGGRGSSLQEALQFRVQRVEDLRDGGLPWNMSWSSAMSTVVSCVSYCEGHETPW